MAHFKTSVEPVHGSCEQLEDRIKGSMQTPGQQQNHSSFQSKAVGIYGVLLTVWYFLQEHPTKGTIMVACDGRSVLDHLKSKIQLIHLQHMQTYFMPAKTYSFKHCVTLSLYTSKDIKTKVIQQHYRERHGWILKQIWWPKAVLAMISWKIWTFPYHSNPGGW